MDTKEELPKAYQANTVEERLYQFWIDQGCFKADAQSNKPPYTIIIPPPNVTGILHMGHALVDTIIDILIRFKRMDGFEALWQPGTDHAGISTQTVVERHLINTEGKRRTDYDRETFLKHVWDWKEKSETTILSQLRKLGCSCDWDRLHFTMDSHCSSAVRRVFKKMFNEGLIYRGDYLVNWDPVTQTALADDEVEHEEKNSSLWYFRYPLEDGSGHLVIATTRPETMLGDVAVAVSPKDERYRNLVGKHIILPIVNRRIPIIEDNYVDPEFGTGAVKITPAHDPNDYEIGIRHELEMINIMTPNGHINENGHHFKGLKMHKAREKVVQEMQRLGLVEKIEPHVHRVGISYRSKAVIEPYLSKQWFVKISSFKQMLIDVVKDGEIQLIPKNWEQTYFHWIENLRDWCISRQLWWGHRIPIWYHKENPDHILCHDGEDLPEEVKKNPEDWIQEEDVLDTWFSSALWPFSPFGWPENTDDFKKFFPNSVLVTGHDILFFWVARMIFMSKYLFDQVPFSKTFLHGLIYGKSYWRMDQEGQAEYVSPEEKKRFDLGEKPPKEISSKWEKMSKSKGNVIDPIEIIDVYGADAMRMALTSSVTHARQIDLDRRKFEEYKNFANKIWNGARFVLSNIDLSSQDWQTPLDLSRLGLNIHSFLSKLNRLCTTVREDLESYHFDRYAISLYDFFWNEFCSIFVETTKPVLFGKVGSKQTSIDTKRILCFSLLYLIRLMHPVSPFITEELYQKIRSLIPNSIPQDSPYLADLTTGVASPSIMHSPYPKPIDSNAISSEIEQQFQLILDFVYTLRNIRGEMKIPLSTEVEVYIQGDGSEKITENIPLIQSLVKVRTIKKANQEPEIPHAFGVCRSLKVYVLIPKEVLEQEKKRLQKEIEKVEKQVSSLEGKLANENFVNKAPKELVSKVQSDLVLAQETLDSLKEKRSLL